MLNFVILDKIRTKVRTLTSKLQEEKRIKTATIRLKKYLNIQEGIKLFNCTNVPLLNLLLENVNSEK